MEDIYGIRGLFSLFCLQTRRERDGIKKAESNCWTVSRAMSTTHIYVHNCSCILYKYWDVLLQGVCLMHAIVPIYVVASTQ